MTPAANFQLPSDVVLTEGHYYGVKMPDYEGDPCVIHPYALVQHDRPEGYMYIMATGERTFEVMTNRPEKANELGKINGLLPMATPRDSDASDRPRRPRMMTRMDTAPEDVRVSQGMAENPVAPALSKPVKPAKPAKSNAKSSVKEPATPPSTPDASLLDGLTAAPPAT